MAKPSNNRHRMDIHALRYSTFNKVSTTKKGDVKVISIALQSLENQTSFMKI